VPVKFPRRLAGLNRAFFNPIQLTYAWLLPPWVVIRHRGRRSGRLYETPVNAYKHGDRLAVVVLYGENSDWVKNVLAGGAEVVRAGRTYELVDVRLVDPRDAADVAPLARMIGRASGKLLVGRLQGPRPGFGRRLT
jgi:deazaflavin-dependent oxidoreductase (nitroreductase family)